VPAPDLAAHRREWEAIASLDPHWAVLSDPEHKFGGWDDQAFFATGEREVAERLGVGSGLGLPEAHETALDFGCGVGRTARALGRRFGECVGVDISEQMVSRARQLNASEASCRFVFNTRPDLSLFGDRSFDLAYSSIVLQHMPSAEQAALYLRELVRLLRDGGLLVFQLPSTAPLSVRLQPRRNLYRLLRRLGVSPRFLYWRLGLHPMSVLSLPVAAVRRVLEEAGAELLQVHEEPDPEFGVTNAVYYARRRRRGAPLSSRRDG
jgi:ubiquinone/menaquinone biosynthesis C-methylase UbiE